MDMTLGFWIILIMFLLFFLTIVIMSIVYSFQVPVSVDGVYRLKDFQLSHNGTDAVDIIGLASYKVHARKEKLLTQSIFNQVISTQVTDPGFTSEEPWEVLAKMVATKIFDDYDVEGISIQILVPDGNNTAGATYSKGSVRRLIRLDAMDE